MKKRSLKSLVLNKKAVSHLTGGNETIDDVFSKRSGCWSKLKMCDPPETFGMPCISHADGCDCTELKLC